MTTTFGALLRQLRRRAQMTQADLAAAVGYSVSFISSLEQNTRRPDVHSVLQHFVPALALQEEPHLATHLLELAAATQGDLPPTQLTFTRERRVVITDKYTDAPNTLPTPPTTLIGRKAMVKLLCDRFLGHSGRLLTLVGAPGVGKTRLALEVAASLQSVHQDGLYFVALAAITDPDLVASTLVTALGLPATDIKSPQRRLLAFLRQKEVLLVLDNFEQITTAAPLLAELLAGCPRLRILVTSRERLHLRAEQRFLVPPLDLVPACTLFTQRAQAVYPAFSLTPECQVTVAEICQLLDCLPLAIELAAVQMALFTPQTLLARLQTQRLDTLNDGPRDLPNRHRSLRAVFDHSWRLLSEAEQQLLAQLSVFRGGFTLHAVEQVTATPTPILLSLMVKSLVRRRVQEQAGRTAADTTVGAEHEERCELHELIRHYAAERLTQLATSSENIHHQHSRFYCHLLTEQARRLHGAEQQAALACIGLEIDNIRATWLWAVTQQQLELLVSAMEGMGLFYEWRNHYQEGETVYRHAVAHLQTGSNGEPVARRVLADALTWQSVFCRLAGHLAEAHGCLQRSLTLLAGLVNTADTQRSKAFALLQLGHVEVAQTEYQAAEPYYRQALALYQTLDDQQGAANVFFGLGAMYYLLCVYGQARTCYEACLEHYRTENDYRNSANTLERLAYIFRDQGLFAEAEQLTMASIDIYEMVGDRAQIAHGQLALGWLHIYTGKLAQAYAAVEKAVPVFEALGLTATLTAPVVLLAIINMDWGRYGEARRQLESYILHCHRVGDHSDLAFSLMLLGAITIVEGNYQAAEPLIIKSIAYYRKKGETDRLAQAIALKGFLVHRLGERAAAHTCFMQALQVAIATQGLAPLVLAILGLALLLAEQGDVERAVELYAMIAENPMVANSQIRQDLVQPIIMAHTTTLPPTVVDAAYKRGQAGDLWSTAALLIERNVWI